MIKIWGAIILAVIGITYLGILLLSSTKESDDKYIVGILKIGYKTFDYFKVKKSLIGVFFSCSGLSSFKRKNFRIEKKKIAIVDIIE